MNAAKVLDDLKRRFPNEPEYHQAVEEVLSTIEEEYNKHPEFDKVNLIERLCIPDRVYQFRVTTFFISIQSYLVTSHFKFFIQISKLILSQ